MFEKMKELITQYVEVDADSITEESRFIEDLGFNSYDIMCMLGDAETEFDVDIDEEAIMKCKTVGDLLEYFGGQK
ncbi:phosphopantetheine-binding protein [Ruminococcus sp. NK3A76]|uniref:acyl carrier protein n=1 Tax=Ruminococcus sp. NK3A76 TaxID=877411 RepID=UPI00048B88E7|nr:phosphopantetheine-binding protein [Ruminococcus sp. NK3A76]